MQDRLRLLSAFAAALLLAAGTASATEPTGKTTQDLRIAGGAKSAGFQFLAPATGEGSSVREGLGAGPDSQRAKRRRSPARFVQLSDFQLAEEESPARVEATGVTAPKSGVRGLTVKVRVVSKRVAKRR